MMLSPKKLTRGLGGGGGGGLFVAFSCWSLPSPSLFLFLFLFDASFETATAAAAAVLGVVFIELSPYKELRRVVVVVVVLLPSAFPETSSFTSIFIGSSSCDSATTVPDSIFILESRS